MPRITEHRNWLKEDELLIAEARIGIRGQYNGQENSEELRITGEKLYDLSGIRTHFAKQIKLRCTADSLPTTDQLKTLLTPYSNQTRPEQNGHAVTAQSLCPVSLIYYNRNATCEITLGESWRVNLDEQLLQTLNSHFKTENVEIVY